MTPDKAGQPLFFCLDKSFQGAPWGECLFPLPFIHQIVKLNEVYVVYSESLQRPLDALLRAPYVRAEVLVARKNVSL